jgi:adenylate cyclase
LPFANLSGDPEQKYFSDGVTADIIAKLSRIEGIFVIDHHSSSAYDGKEVTARKVSRELGVRYIVTGSVLVIRERVRINANLIDGLSNRQIWPQQYESGSRDIFLLLNDVSDRIVGVILSETWRHEELERRDKPTDQFRAYDYVLRGRQQLFELTPESNALARRNFTAARSLDKRYARAHAYLAWTYLNEMRLGWAADPMVALRLAQRSAIRAVELDDFEAVGHEARRDT